MQGAYARMHSCPHVHLPMYAHAEAQSAERMAELEAALAHMATLQATAARVPELEAAAARVEELEDRAARAAELEAATVAQQGAAGVLCGLESSNKGLASWRASGTFADSISTPHESGRQRAGTCLSP